VFHVWTTAPPKTPWENPEAAAEILAAENALAGLEDELEFMLDVSDFGTIFTVEG